MDEGMVAFGGEGTAGFQTCCIADVPIGGGRKSGARSSGGRRAGWETRDTADLEVCGTTKGQSDSFFTGAVPQDAPPILKAVDRTGHVIHNCITMKTATIRDLRNRFPRVAAWITEERVRGDHQGREIVCPPRAARARQIAQARQARHHGAVEQVVGQPRFHRQGSRRHARGGIGRRRKMIAFPDTSFLCAIYRRQDNSPQAAAYFKAMPEALYVSGLLLYEFRQSVRFQVWLHAQDKAKGYPQTDCHRKLWPIYKPIWTPARWWW